MQQLLLRRFFCRSISLGFGLFLLSGCAGFNSGLNQSTPRYNKDPSSNTEFDELLAFGNNMALSPTSSRAKMCRSLMKYPRGDTGNGIWLRLMVGRLLSDACGNIPRILDGVKSIPPSSLDLRTQKLVNIDTEALMRLNSMPRRLVVKQSKQKPAPSQVESKPAKVSNSHETRLLREKLEAIRTMEKQMDESDTPE